MKIPRFTRAAIAPDFFGQHEIDLGKVARYVEQMKAGDVFPPVIVASYGDKVMPLDGHHRLAACKMLGKTADAWVCKGAAFERFCNKVGGHEADQAILAAFA